MLLETAYGDVDPCAAVTVDEIGKVTFQSDVQVNGELKFDNIYVRDRMILDTAELYVNEGNILATLGDVPYGIAGPLYGASGHSLVTVTETFYNDGLGLSLSWDSTHNQLMFNINMSPWLGGDTVCASYMMDQYGRSGFSIIEQGKDFYFATGTTTPNTDYDTIVGHTIRASIVPNSIHEIINDPLFVIEIMVIRMIKNIVWTVKRINAN